MQPVYLLLGPEKGNKEEFINNLKKSLKDCEVTKFYAFDNYEDELFAQLVNNDFFCSHRLVILEAAEEIKTVSKAKALSEYIRSPFTNSTLVLSSDELYVNPLIMDSMPNPKESIIRFFEMFDNKKEQWLTDFFRTNGFLIDAQAIQTIIDRVENNIYDFTNICSQMVVYFKADKTKKKITFEDLDTFLLHTRREDVFSLFSYIAYGKLEKALSCLQVILNTTESGKIGSIIPRLSLYFRRLYSTQKILLSTDKTEDDALKDKYYETDRPVTKFKDKNTYKAALMRYKIKDVQRILSFLSEFDIKVKEIGPSLQKILLERCVVRIIRNKGAGLPEFQFAKL